MHGDGHSGSGGKHRTWFIIISSDAKALLTS